MKTSEKRTSSLERTNHTHPKKMVDSKSLEIIILQDGPFPDL